MKPIRLKKIYKDALNMMYQQTHSLYSYSFIKIASQKKNSYVIRNSFLLVM